jgi:UDP-N-acetylglucosamine kinase
MEYSDDNSKIIENAIKFAKENKRKIAKEVISTTKVSAKPFSYFMAGSAGAGKTEFSINALKLGWIDENIDILRIDPDEYRKYFVDYSGQNSHLFQAGVSIITEKILDICLDRNISFLISLKV